MKELRSTRYIAKCKGCNIHSSALSKGQDVLKARAPGVVYQDNMGWFRIDCRKCGEPQTSRMVKGKVSQKHECNAKCLSSTGGVCECSCGGKNHGASYESSEGT